MVGREVVKWERGAECVRMKFLNSYVLIMFPMMFPRFSIDTS
jgi:hypothetical protein